MHGAAVVGRAAGRRTASRPAKHQDPERSRATPAPSAGDLAPAVAEPRSAHDVIVSAVPSTARGTVGVVTSAAADQARRARAARAAAERALPRPRPAAPRSASSSSTEPRRDRGRARRGGRHRAGAGAGLALGTASGVVKRVAPDYPQNAAEFEVIALKDGDRVVGAVQLTDEDRTWCSSPATPSCCGSTRPRCGRRAGRPAGWPASGCARAAGSGPRVGGLRSVPSAAGRGRAGRGHGGRQRRAHCPARRPRP